MKYSTSLRPGGRSFSSPIQRSGHSERSRQSRQYGNSAAGVNGGESGFVFIFTVISGPLMRLPRILNQCHPIPGFVYGQASFAEGEQAILIAVRPGKRSVPFAPVVIGRRPATTRPARLPGFNLLGSDAIRSLWFKAGKQTTRSSEPRR